MIKKNKSYFQKMLAGKRCAVVASSGFLKNRRLGSYIDNFDFIARCNIWTFDNSQSLDLGSRCDFWYGRPLVQHLKLKLETFNENYIKLLCLLPRTKEGWEHWDEDHSKFLNEYNHLKFNYRVIDVDEYLQFEEKLSSVPYTGILAIHDLLLNGAAEVHAIGFDFYKSGYSHSVPVGRTNTFNGRHDLIACQKYLWELIKNEPRFKCDYHLQSILEKIFKPTFKRNASKLVKILDSEIHQFCDEFKEDNILIFRSCNIEVFEIIAKCIRKFWAYSQISVIIQKSIINNYSIKDLELITYDSNEPISFDFIMSKKKSIINKNIKVCFIPYNDLELHTYYNIFNILVKLNIEKVFLINLDGFIKVMPHPRELCKDIKFYLNNKQNFLKLRDLYDSKSIY